MTVIIHHWLCSVSQARRVFRVYVCPLSLSSTVVWDFLRNSPFTLKFLFFHSKILESVFFDDILKKSFEFEDGVARQFVVRQSHWDFQMAGTFYETAKRQVIVDNFSLTSSAPLCDSNRKALILMKPLYFLATSAGSSSRVWHCKVNSRLLLQSIASSGIEDIFRSTRLCS